LECEEFEASESGTFSLRRLLLDIASVQLLLTSDI